MPTYNEAELAAIKRAEDVAEATRLDDDEEDALKDATTDDLMTLAEILGSNPQEFIMEAYADPLKGGGTSISILYVGKKLQKYFLDNNCKLHFCISAKP